MSVAEFDLALLKKFSCDCLKELSIYAINCGSLVIEANCFCHNSRKSFIISPLSLLSDICAIMNFSKLSTGYGFFMTKQDNNEVAVIKKYANRRLYNTQTSCYITLEDLYQMIRIDEDFIVVDAKTGEDLTRATLTQIIFEQEAKGYNLLPISFLRRVISLYDNNTMGHIFPNYLNISIENFMQNQEKFRQFGAEGWKEFTPMKIFENIAKQNMDIFENAMKMFSPDNKDK